jgi:hypothetical protein
MTLATYVHNGFSLFGYTDTRQVFGLRLGFGRLDLQDFVAFGTFRHGVFQALARINLVHGVFYTAVRINVGDEHLWIE